MGIRHIGWLGDQLNKRKITKKEYDIQVSKEHAKMLAGTRLKKVHQG